MCFLLLPARCYICSAHTQTTLVAYFLCSPMAHVASAISVLFSLCVCERESEGIFFLCVCFSPYKLWACTLYKMQNNMICSYIFFSSIFRFAQATPFECTQGNEVESKSNCAKINGPRRRLFKLKFNRIFHLHFNFSTVLWYSQIQFRNLLYFNIKFKLVAWNLREIPLKFRWCFYKHSTRMIFNVRQHEIFHH